MQDEANGFTGEHRRQCWPYTYVGLLRGTWLEANSRSSALTAWKRAQTTNGDVRLLHRVGERPEVVQ